ncbi:MAG: glycosyltransferase, partial [Bacteroidetes bacterium]|nr:glycosyltransferase [Bacteroidota bacterium]
MRVIIAGGGTGGHIFPAVSIAEEIMDKDKNNEILFIGTKRGMEGELV